jgi:tRNA G18 (ribose-2'-O)-methylase SpoU
MSGGRAREAAAGARGIFRRMRIVEIARVDDPRVADYRNVRDADLRARGGLFVAEGRLNVKRLLRGSPHRTRSVFVTPAGLAGVRDALSGLAEEVPVFLAGRDVLSQVVGYAMHRGCLAAGERCQEVGLDAAFAHTAAGPRLWVALEDVTNPDNVGGIFRNALAFGVERLLLSPRCADPLYRKSIRVSMGAALRLPFGRAPRWPAELERLREAGFLVLALDAARDARDIASVAIPPSARGVAVLIGSEDAGLSEPARAQADARVTIPMASGIDSLNAATASGIALHRIASALGLV